MKIGWMDGWMDGLMGRRMDGWMDKRTHGRWMDGHKKKSYFGLYLCLNIFDN